MRSSRDFGPNITQVEHVKKFHSVYRLTFIGNLWGFFFFYIFQSALRKSLSLPWFLSPVTVARCTVGRLTAVSPSV